MSLSSLLVQREIASIREIEEALARQVLYGGDFVTNLFEVSRLEEAALMPTVAESFGLGAAPIGELPKVPDDAARLVVGEVASERKLLPLEVGAALVVAVAEPLPKEVEQELTFALALRIEQRIAPMFRIRQALARDYGYPIDRRTARLITKVVHKGPRMASTFPPPRDSKPNLPARVPTAAPPPVAPITASSLFQAAMPPAVAPPAASIEAPRTTAAQAGTLVRKAEAPPERPSRRRRGPLTMDVAIAELEASAERDVIFDILFEFARQFFDYTALFLVHGELAEGRDAFGDGAARDKVARIGVPLDLPNMLTTARAQKRIVRARPSSEGIDPVLMSDLGRTGQTECIALPIVVRTRVVALVFGDGGDSGLDDVGIGQVEELVAASAGAFERVIMRRKLKSQPDPNAERGVAVAQRNAAHSVAPPPTQVSQPLTSSPSPSRPPAPPYMSQRPAAEELAPPIRELLGEPSRSALTRREPTPDAVLPAGSQRELVPRSTSDRPPPANLLAVRRPSGAPIPREEASEAKPSLQGAQGAQASQASQAPQAPHAPQSQAQGGPPRTKSQSLKRAAAPPLEFGVPSVPSVVSDQGDAPRTTRDVAPVHASIVAREPQRPPEPAPQTPRSTPSQPPISAGPMSPRARSPLGMPAVSAPITDVSPQPLGPVGTTPRQAPRVMDRLPQGSELNRTMKSAGFAGGNFAARTLLEGELPQLPGPPPAAPAPAVAAPAPAPAVATPASTTASTAPRDVVERSSPISPLVVITPDEEMRPVGRLDADVTPVTPSVFDDAWETPAAPAAAPPAASMPASPPRSPPASPPRRPSDSKRDLADMKMPVSEQQVSVKAHKPPSSRSDHTRVLPSVIVDVASEYVALVNRVLAGPDEEAETELLRAGGYAMPAIMERFPGPITIEPDRLAAGALPRVAECGPIIRLIASQRRTALPFVLSHVGSDDADKRFWATYLLTELTYPDSIDPAAQRLYDDDARVRRAARAAIRSLAEVHPQLVVERVGEVAKNDREHPARRARAIEALGEAREPSAIPCLYPILDGPPAELAAAARAALVAITAQDFNLDSRKWFTWWEANKQRHRLEWLIDSLMSDHRVLRSAASEELKGITKEYFGYYDDLPKRERERSQARFREWWEKEGRVRFSRASTRGG